MKSMPKTMETTLAIMLNSPLWIGKRFFQSFLSGFTIAISARAQILTLALINLCIILIVVDGELSIFKGLVENNLMYSFENATNYQNTTSNALNGLHDDGEP
jgi:hypothetical protein